MKGIVLSLLCAIIFAQGRELLTRDGRLVCNCNPGEANGICAAWDSDGTLVAHQHCDRFYICNDGKPVAMACPAGLLYNVDDEKCDWPANVDCGDRTISDSEDGVADCDGSTTESDSGAGDSGAGDGGAGDGGAGDNDTGSVDGDDNGNTGTCNCNPGEAPSICSATGSEGVLVAHENCNQFYQCAGGIPVTLTCPGYLLYNPYTEQCDWPENVNCGDRVIPDAEDGGNGAGGEDSDSGTGDGGGDAGVGGGDGDSGVGGGDGDNGAGGGTCNCNPGEAPEICAAEGSEDILVAHENCNQFYKCSYGKPVALHCPGNLLYNPYTEQCDWPENVDCGDRVIPDCEDDNGEAAGSTPAPDGDTGVGGGEGDSDVDDGGSDNDAGGEDGDTGGSCNCNPGEAPSICAANDSNGTLIAHENCNQFYICDNGKPVTVSCPGVLLFNPYTELCDWPDKVDCGDRVIPDCDDESNGGGGNGDGDSGNGDTGASSTPTPDGDSGVGGGDGDSGVEGEDNESGGSCNCNPEEAPGICAADESNGVLVAHENCNQFYICDNGKPKAFECPGGLLFNPYTNQCDWPEKVDCGDRIIPDYEDESNGGGGNGDGDSGNGDSGTGSTPVPEGDGGAEGGDGDGGSGDVGDGGGSCNCNPGEAPSICATEGSDGVLIAHENCNKFYMCAQEKPVAMRCPSNLLFNPHTKECDWPEKVDCGDRIIPDCEDGGNGDAGSGDGESGDGDSGTGEGDGDTGVGDGGSDNGAGDGGGNGTCNCNPGEAPSICAADDSDGVLVAHENCNQFYMCAHGKPVNLTCPGNLLFNPYIEVCDWPENVECGDRVIPEGDDGENGAGDGGGDAGVGGGDGDGGTGEGEGDSGVGGGDGDNGAGDGGNGTCNCNPGEAPEICAVDGSDGTLIAHENCNKFYMCAHGTPVAMKCPGNLLYNPYTEICDWPENVECGDRVIPECEDDADGGDSDSGTDGEDGGAGGGEGDGGVGGGEGDGGIGGGEGDGGVGGGEGDGGIGGGDGDNGAGGGTCNCNPGEAPEICAVDGSDGTLIAHENCNKFYICAHGKPAAMKCPGNLLYNPYTQECDWPEKVECGDRVIPDADDGDNGAGGGEGDGGVGGGEGDSGVGGGEGDGGVGGGEGDGGVGGGEGDGGVGGGEGDGGVGGGEGDGGVGGGEGDGGVGGGDGDNGAGGDGGGNGSCNCNPGEAPKICATDGSDGVLVAHENCNQFYKCSYGKPVALSCPGNLLYNPYTEQCDWPENVDCGDRVIPEVEDGDNGTGGGEGDDGVGGGDGDNGAAGGGGGNGSCNCNPGEAPKICAADGSDGVLVAHENCNQFYKCSYGVPVALSCPGNLLYNPYTEQCDWPENVDCGDRVIPDVEETPDTTPSPDGDTDVGGGEGDNGAGDGAPDNVPDNGPDNGPGTGCNCNPGEAPTICAADGAEGVLVAHENCNQFYKCSNGKPVALNCSGVLLYNPYTEQCDWPKNVDCGDRVIPDGEDSGNGDGDSGDDGAGDGGEDSDAGDNGSVDPEDGGDDSNVGGNDDPSQAPSICAAPGSEGVLVAHEDCDKFYVCNGGKAVTMDCPSNLLFNPAIDSCDWPRNVDCGNRTVPETDDGGSDTCNCNPRMAPALCARAGSNGVMIAHENCEQYYMCVNGATMAYKCPSNLFYNPMLEVCDWPINVDCDTREIPTSQFSLNKHLEARQGVRV